MPGGILNPAPLVEDVKVVCFPVKVCAPSWATVKLPVGKVGVVAAVTVKLSVNVPVVWRVEPAASVSVAALEGLVKVKLDTELPLIWFALIAPVPIGASTPDVFIEIPLAVPCAVTRSGSAVEDDAVLILTSGPVRALLAVSVKLKMDAVDEPVSAAAVHVKSVVEGLACALHEKAVVYVLIARLRFPVGTPKPDHAADPAPQVAVPEFTKFPDESTCKQYVDAPARLGNVM